MDSPLLQSTAKQQPLQQRLQVQPSYRQSSNPTSTVDQRGAIQKRSNTGHHQSLSTTKAEQLYRLAADQGSQQSQPAISHQPINLLSASINWITPQHSPEPQGFATVDQSVQPYSHWTVPTPPHSDSGVPNVSIDPNEEPVTCAPNFTYDQTASAAEMSSLGFLLPSQYGSEPYNSEQNNYTMDQNYIPPMRMTQPPTSAGATAYAQPQTTTASSSPALYQSRGSEPSSNRRAADMPVTTGASASTAQSYDQNYRRVSNPYEQPGQGSGYTVGPSQSIPSISGLTQSPVPSPHMGHSAAGQIMAQPYSSGMSRTPNMYDNNVYGQPPYTTAPSATQLYPTAQNMSYPQPYQNGGAVSDVLGKQPISDSSIRVLNQRPKPQCWEHGCNGRQFSTFSNLLRHQREKSGTAAKSYCPKCGAEFTRTTARNGHLAHDKCTKQRRQSDGK